MRIYSRTLTQEDVTALFTAGADTEALTANLVNVAHGANIDFTVLYVDNLAVDVGTLDGSDIRVTGPGGFDQLAGLNSVATTSSITCSRSCSCDVPLLEAKG